MPLRDHLVEFRRRIVRAALGILIGAVIGWFLYEPAFRGLTEPIMNAADDSGRLISINFAGVAAPFDMRLRVSFFLGLVISSPWWIYQLWAYITPGLTTKERRYTIGFLAAAAPMFLGGVTLAWWVLPRAVVLLVNFAPDDTTNLLDAQGYLTFVMRVMLAFGIAFLLPIIMVGLSMADIVLPGTWLANWRWAVVGASVFAAIATPDPGMISMLVLGSVIVLLYFIAIAISTILAGRRQGARDADPEAGA